MQGHDGRESLHKAELNTEGKSDQIYSALMTASTGFVPALCNTLHVALGPRAAGAMLDGLVEKPSPWSLAVLCRISS